MNENLIALNVQNLNIWHANNTLLVKNCCFQLEMGKTTALIGESGSGKSLTALAILRLLPEAISVDPNTQIVLDNQNLCVFSESKMQKIRGNKIAIVFQDPMTSLNPVMTIHSQMEEAFSKQLTSQYKKQEILKLLNRVKISDPERICNQYPHQLSGGMKQRIIIAMALAHRPHILIADEPTTALDVTIQAEILELLSELQKDLNMSMLFITHDLAVASEIAHSILVMRKGELIERGSVKQLLNHPQKKYTQQLISVAPAKVLEPICFGNKKILQIKNLTVSFPISKGLLRRRVGSFKAVDDISFDLRQGETLALVGESGSGKTTVGKTILNLIQPTMGEVIYNEKINMHCNTIQMIVQDPFAAMNPRMKVVDIIKEGLLAQKIGHTEEEKQTKINDVLAQVELSLDYKNRYPHQLSGGQRQRVCIARALAVNPKILICDEPTSSLDVWHQAHLIDLLIQLQSEYGLTYLFITHNLSIVRSMAHTVAVMLKGRIVEYGDKNTVLDNPQHPFTKQLLQAVPKLRRPPAEKIHHNE